jgi:hypothetical protein
MTSIFCARAHAPTITGVLGWDEPGFRETNLNGGNKRMPAKKKAKKAAKKKK